MSMMVKLALKPAFALALAIAALVLGVVHAAAQDPAKDLIVEKKVFELATFTTQSGRTLKGVKVGWESYGRLNADRSNAILICHFFSANSHAAGKYAASEAAPGYWDAIIGPGKAIDTDKYFVLSSDTLVNLNTGDPRVTTTGPATLDPATSKPYGMDFPVVTIRDFIEVQKALVESLGIRTLVMVAGASMGALQTYEWAATYPDMVGRIMPVIGAGDTDANLIGWMDIWASPIRLDPKWNGGDYYGREPPNAGLALALQIVTLHANHWEWANATFATPAGAKPAKDGEDPAKSLDAKFAIEATLAGAGATRAKVSDANHFLYLAKANQVFAGSDGKARMAKIKAPTLLIYSPKDLVFPGDYVKATAEQLAKGGARVETFELKGNRGHLDGVLSMKQAEAAIAAFMSK
jgi:homoserine O-acetyltransferase/O-succinyltransferase